MPHSAPLWPIPLFLLAYTEQPCRPLDFYRTCFVIDCYLHSWVRPGITPCLLFRLASADHCWKTLVRSGRPTCTPLPTHPIFGASTMTKWTVVHLCGVPLHLSMWPFQQPLLEGEPLVNLNKPNSGWEIFNLIMTQKQLRSPGPQCSAPYHGPPLIVVLL